MKPIDQQTIMITGATDGLGKATALELARMGATLILHGRNAAKGQAVVDEIRSQSGNDKIAYYNADFSSLSSVRELANELLNDYTCIDTLVSNAGLGSGSRSAPVRELTADGYELRFTVNYLSHYMLTKLILPIIPDGGRIINVSSIGQTELDFDDIMIEKNYTPSRAYCQSKLAQIMHIIDLSDELATRQITANALHPSTYMNTKMVMEHFGEPQSTIAEGVEALLRLVCDEKLDDVSGKYFNVLEEAKALPQAYNPEARAKLRAISEKLIEKY